MGDAPATTVLLELRDEIRRRLGPQAEGLADAADELTDSVCFWWPVGYMANLARKAERDPHDILSAISVVEAKAREDVESRFGVSANTLRAIDLLLPAIVREICGLWFGGIQYRIAVQRAVKVARKSR